MNDFYDTYETDFNDFANLKCSKLITTFPQPLAMISTMSNKRLAIKTGPIKITSRGIPRLCGPEDRLKYIERDDQRAFIYLSLDPNQPECVKLEKCLNAADKYFGSNEFKKNLFGINRYNSYEYMPIIRKKLSSYSD